MSAGYNDPGFGLPGSGGSFIGTGKCWAPCCIPPDIQPAIPPDGLFGPDMPLPGWGFPGFKPASNITHPLMPYILPEIYPGKFSFDDSAGGDLPGTRPSLNLPGFGLTVYSGDELTAALKRKINAEAGKLLAKYPSPIIWINTPPVKTVAVSSDEATGGSSGSSSESAGETQSDGGGGFLGFLKGAAKAAWSAVKKGVNAVTYAAKSIYNTVKKTLNKVGKAIGHVLNPGEHSADVAGTVASYYTKNIIAGIFGSLYGAIFGFATAVASLPFMSGSDPVINPDDLPYVNVPRPSDSPVSPPRKHDFPQDTAWNAENPKIPSIKVDEEQLYVLYYWTRNDRFWLE